MKVTDERGNELDFNFCPGDLVTRWGVILIIGVVITVSTATKDFGDCLVMWSDKGITRIATLNIFQIMKVK